MFNKRISSLGLALTLTQVACNAPTEGYFGEFGSAFQRSLNPPPSETVCNPLGGSQPTDDIVTSENGILASLHSLDESSYSRPMDDLNLSQFIRHNIPLQANLYFNKIDVPTRSFTAGFQAQDGSLLTNPHTGDPLHEYFMLRFRSDFKVAPHQAGLYQFAILSDDGSILRLGDPGQAALVTNDGNHPSQFRCANRTIHLRAGETLPLQLDYYQGPRHHIAVMLLWRKVSVNSDLNDRECSAPSGNDRYFEFERLPSTPKSPYLDLLKRGWSVVPAQNFYMPKTITGETPKNPCIK